MMTVRQIERGWKARQLERLFADLAAHRPEMVNSKPESGWEPIAAAMAVIRLDELAQSHVPLSATLIRSILQAQQEDGGWGDLISTAICLRALFCSNGDGLSIDRGLAFLANLQKSEGIWPAIPLRRMPEDASVSALILYELGDQARFHSTVRVADAVAWFERNEDSIDLECQRLWHRAELRCQRQMLSREKAEWALV